MRKTREQLFFLMFLMNFRRSKKLEIHFVCSEKMFEIKYSLIVFTLALLFCDIFFPSHVLQLPPFILLCLIIFIFRIFVVFVFFACPLLQTHRCRTNLFHQDGQTHAQHDRNCTQILEFTTHNTWFQLCFLVRLTRHFFEVKFAVFREFSIRRHLKKHDKWATMTANKWTSPFSRRRHLSIDWFNGWRWWLWWLINAEMKKSQKPFCRFPSLGT